MNHNEPGIRQLIAWCPVHYFNVFVLDNLIIDPVWLYLGLLGNLMTGIVNQCVIWLLEVAVSLQETTLLLHKSMDNSLNGQRNRFKSYAEKSPPLKKMVYILSIYVIIRLLLLSKRIMNRPFRCIRFGFDNDRLFLIQKRFNYSIWSDKYSI